MPTLGKLIATRPGAQTDILAIVDRVDNTTIYSIVAKLDKSDKADTRVGEGVPKAKARLR